MRKKSGSTLLGEALPRRNFGVKINSSATPLSCGVLKTLLVFLVLKIHPALTKLQH